jgi:1-acyl-sn-glycerol-3-phosphate acyltransferase
MILYRTAQRLARALWSLAGTIDVQGLENIPENGPCIVIANHQSYVDPVLIQAWCRRPLHTMAKSTQFSTPGLGWLMKKLLSFPVRRWEIDPQAARIVLRRLQAGEAVCVYIEGERSWDARLQPPRRGTLRLILKAGVPVIPCAIEGTYDFWPRWGRPRQGAHVSIIAGPPIRFPQSDDRAERDRLLPAAAERLMATLRDLVEQARSASREGDVRRGQGGASMGTGD